MRPALRLRYPRMPRMLHLLGRAPDFETEVNLRAVRGDAGVGRGATVRRIGRGGDYANLFWAVIRLRRDVGSFDVVHAWDGVALTAALLAGAKRVVFASPPDVRARDVDRLRWVMRRRNALV